MKLYEINNTIRNVIENGYIYDEETGEISFDETDLDNLDASRAEKLLACAKVLKEIRANENAIKEEKKALGVRELSMRKKADNLVKYITDNTQDKEKFEDSQASISFRKSSRIVLDCSLEELPHHLVRTVTTKSADKTMIKKNINSLGDFAHLEESRNLQVK